MIKLGYLGEAIHCNVKEDDMKVFIVRKPVNGIPLGFVHNPILSPSVDLFKDTRRWKNGEYNEMEVEFLLKNNHPLSPDSWWYLYEPRFIDQLNLDVSIRELDKLKEMSKDRDVWLFCYCKDYCRCHRSIVGKKLEQMGCDVYHGNREKNGDIFNQVSFFDDY